ncbi:hypothetical protein INR49_029390 [Caranx melampygus]|nr:hypothetical protein INR49_029390 [Caranx melampygus]
MSTVAKGKDPQTALIHLLPSVMTNGAVFFPSSQTPGLKKGKTLSENKHPVKVYMWDLLSTLKNDTIPAS